MKRIYISISCAALVIGFWVTVSSAICSSPSEAGNINYSEFRELSR